MKVLFPMLIILLLVGCATESRPLYTTPEPQADDRFAEQRRLAIANALTRDPASGEESFRGETVYVILSDFRFDPERIPLKAGQITRVRLSNTAWVTHYFGGDEFFRQGAEVVNLLGSNVPPSQHHIPVPPFTERDLYLFAKQPGEYPLNCFVPTHRKAGMDGVLIVIP